jgi:type IV secretory pathway TrbL component
MTSNTLAVIASILLSSSGLGGMTYYAYSASAPRQSAAASVSTAPASTSASAKSASATASATAPRASLGPNGNREPRERQVRFPNLLAAIGALILQNNPQFCEENSDFEVCIF